MWCDIAAGGEERTEGAHMCVVGDVVVITRVGRRVVEGGRGKEERCGGGCGRRKELVCWGMLCLGGEKGVVGGWENCVINICDPSMRCSRFVYKTHCGAYGVGSLYRGGVVLLWGRSTIYL